jgi:hypothetical protein
MGRYLIRDHTQRLFGGLEATFGAGAAATLAATDAVRFISASLEETSRRYIANEEMTGNRGQKVGVNGAYEPLPVKVVIPLLGASAVDVAPDFAAWLKAAGLLETTSAGVHVNYARDPTGVTACDYSAWLTSINADKSAADYYAGIPFQEIAIPGIGTNLARIEFTGQAAKASHFYQCTVGTGGITNVATALPLTAHHGLVHGGVDFLIEVTDGTNTEVMKVTAVSGVTATVVRNVLAAGAFAFVSTDTIRAYCPAATVTADEQIGDRAGSLTLDDGAGGGAINLDFYKADLVIHTGQELEEKQGFEEYRKRVISEKFSEDGVVFTVDMPFAAGSTGESYLHRLREDNTAVALVLTIGTVATDRVVITIPTAHIRSVKAPRAGTGARKGTVIFVAHSADGLDFSMKFN